VSVSRFIICLVLSSLTCSLQAQVTVSASDTSLIEVMPEYPGGYQKFFKYISKEFKVPASAGKSIYQGTVLITMIVDQDGKVLVDSLNYEKMAFYSKKPDEALKTKAHNELDAEIRRVFTSMPNWKPGIQEGRPVRVKYTLPYHISFQ
jgi:hypothetical protein